MKRFYIDYTVNGHIEVYAENEAQAEDMAYALVEDGDGCMDDFTVERMEDCEDDE